MPLKLTATIMPLEQLTEQMKICVVREICVEYEGAPGWKVCWIGICYVAS